jgi:hypothetical protein
MSDSLHDFEPLALPVYRRATESLARVFPPLVEQMLEYRDAVASRFGRRPRTLHGSVIDKAERHLKSLRSDARVLRWILHDASTAELKAVRWFETLIQIAIVDPDPYMRKFVQLQLDKRMSARSLLLAGAMLYKQGRWQAGR